MDAGLYRSLYPERTTEPCGDFLRSAGEVTFFAYEMFELARTADVSVPAALAYTLIASDSVISPERIIEMVGRVKGTPAPVFTRAIEGYGPFMAEMTICRAIDNFLTYVARLLRLVFVEKPETLKSGKQVKIEDVLRQRSLEEFIGWLADEQVFKLSRQGSEELNNYWEKCLGMPVYLGSDRTAAARLIEIRNLLVHNRGVVTDRFVKKVGTIHGDVGDRLQISLHDAVQGAINLWAFGVSLDKRAVKKFQLPTPIEWAVPNGT